MTDKELLDIIHESVGENLSVNKKDYLEHYHSLTSSFSTMTDEQEKQLSAAIFDYTTFIMEATCIAMSRVLALAGILETSPSDN